MHRWMKNASCRSFFKFASAIAFLLTSFFATHGAWAADRYTFAVVPQFEQRKLFAIWKPIVDELSQRTGLDISLVTTLSIPEFERELDRGSYDFVYTNHYHILKAYDRQGYLPLVRDATPLRGILVVRKDSPLKSPADMDGKQLAIPSNNALGASLLLRADLENLFQAHVRTVNVRTHSAVYMNVLTGVVEAGGGVEKTLQEQSQNVQNGLRILYTTRDIPSHPIAVHPRVPLEVRERVRNALLEMAATPQGAALFDKVPITKMIPTSIADYVVMKGWGLDRYWVDESH